MSAPNDDRAHALTAISDSLAGEKGGGWLARAIAERIEKDLDDREAAKRTAADQIATVLTSGLSGPPLCAELWKRFPGANRADAFMGAAMAASLFQADVALARLASAQAQLEQVGA